MGLVLLAPALFALVLAVGSPTGANRRSTAKGSSGDQAIRDAYQAGLLMADIGKVVGLTHQLVSNIIRRKP